MIDLNRKEECCGCSACCNICPVNCIEMVKDEEGFVYPHIDKNKCINCHLCEKVCPFYNKTFSNKPLKGFVLQTKDNENLKESTSGGFFMNFAREIIGRGGAVYGCTSINNTIKHVRIDSISNIGIFNGSKYVQSDISSIYNEILEDAKNDLYIGISGTPCQINAIKLFLELKHINMEKIYFVDLVCHGVPSSKVREYYINYQQKKYKSEVVYFNFRYKTYGYHSSTMKLVFKNKKRYYGSARVDYMLKSFYDGLTYRPSCYECNAKGNQRCSDFTIFDCWHFEFYTGIHDNNKGHTNVIVNTIKGANFFENIKKSYICYEYDYTKMIELDGKMYDYSSTYNKFRKDFYIKLDELGLEKTIKLTIPISMKDKFIEKLKKIYYFRSYTK